MGIRLKDIYENRVKNCDYHVKKLDHYEWYQNINRKSNSDQKAEYLKENKIGQTKECQQTEAGGKNG